MFDLRLFGDTPASIVLERWRQLRETTGCESAVHARQRHGTRILRHDRMAEGLLVAEDADAHATQAPGVLLTVSVADCVPVFVVDPGRRTVALLHAGWRGVAAGMIENGITALGEMAGSAPADLMVHLGPSICGECYEVGPEVHHALGEDAPDGRAPVDLRVNLAQRAIGLGVPPRAISISEHCTHCGESPFFSHRRGCAERQVGFLAVAR